MSIHSEKKMGNKIHSNFQIQVFVSTNKECKLYNTKHHVANILPIIVTHSCVQAQRALGDQDHQ